ncbi:hypothetical protein MNBD_ACTINO01-1605 [hydrothermal vent metagenome]|uniref:Uncharacterized protein n=1 Tax=hydrothermal vent metagenome TaxID=652676 RepID=A0A3B0SAS3_9ZZZZ
MLSLASCLGPSVPCCRGSGEADSASHLLDGCEERSEHRRVDVRGHPELLRKEELGAIAVVVVASSLEQAAAASIRASIAGGSLGSFDPGREQGSLRRVVDHFANPREVCESESPHPSPCTRRRHGVGRLLPVDWARTPTSGESVESPHGVSDRVGGPTWIWTRSVGRNLCRASGFAAAGRGWDLGWANRRKRDGAWSGSVAR